MHLRRLTPMLHTNDIPATINFYKKYLNFICGEYNTDWQWASMHQGAIEIMLAKPNEHTPFSAANFTGSFYFEVDNVEEYWHQLKDVVTIYYAIDSFEYGMRDFAILDNNGYIIQIGQPIA